MTVQGQQLVDLLRTRIGEAYRLGIAVDLDDPNYRGRKHGTLAPLDVQQDRAWDCAELVSWGVATLDGRRIGCGPEGDQPYTGYWATESLAGKQCTRIPVADALWTPGAALLRAPDGPVGGHIGVAVGNGRGTVEAYATKHGVVERDDAHRRRWDCGVVLAGWSYTSRQPAITEYFAPVVLRAGARGPQVVVLQQTLGIRADGIYGRDTTAAVRAYQARVGLVADGEAGPLTLRSLQLSATRSSPQQT